MSIQVQPVIMAGGSGTRLWPLSRAGYPKQFLVLSGDSSNQFSLFQQAAQRLQGLAAGDISVAAPSIVGNEDHRFLVLDQLREIKLEPAAVLLEPVGRNTAPAVTLAALAALEAGGVDYVTKPIKPKEVLALIEAHISAHHPPACNVTVRELGFSAHPYVMARDSPVNTAAATVRRSSWRRRPWSATGPAKHAGSPPACECWCTTAPTAPATTRSNARSATPTWSSPPRSFPAVPHPCWSPKTWSRP